jgi:hypothetical protein
VALRNRGGKWHYRFKVDGKRYAGTTGLAATTRNATKAHQVEAEHREALLEGRNPSRKVQVREFTAAAKDFLEWAQAEYRAHPSRHQRIATSFASATEFFGRETVSLIDDAHLEAFKTWRINKHKVRDVTLRHDLHALSKFFGYAVRQKWDQGTPIRRTWVLAKHIPHRGEVFEQMHLPDSQKSAVALLSEAVKGGWLESPAMADDTFIIVVGQNLREYHLGDQ